MKRMAIAALFTPFLFLAACSQPAPAPEASTEAPPAEPAVTATPPLTATTPMTAADLVDCAGALAAAGNVEIAATGPTVDNAATNSVWTILALLDKEEGYKSDAAKGRADVIAARDQWKTKPAPELAARSASCATRFPG